MLLFNEIERIKIAKGEIKTLLESLGYEIPETAKLDEFKSYCSSTSEKTRYKFECDGLSTTYINSPHEALGIYVETAEKIEGYPVYQHVEHNDLKLHMRAKKVPNGLEYWEDEGITVQHIKIIYAWVISRSSNVLWYQSTTNDLGLTYDWDAPFVNSYGTTILDGTSFIETPDLKNFIFSYKGSASSELGPGDIYCSNGKITRL